MKSLVCLGCILMFSGPACWASELNVPGDFLTIQAAIDAAVNHDTVILADGTYHGDGNRDISFLGKQIIVKSEHGPDNCVINCQGTEDDPHKGFIFVNDETQASILDGITVTGGYARYGGGIYTHNSDPVIMDCIITGNTAFQNGGGIYCSSAQIINSVIEKNHSSGGGGGLYCGSDSNISKSVIRQNSTDDYYLFFKLGGGGVLLEDNATISDCLVENNQTMLNGGGIYCGDYTSVTRCIIQSNSLADDNCEGGGLYSWEYSQVYNCIIRNNSASGPESSGGGGGVVNFSTISDCKIYGNSTNGNGGGIKCYYDSVSANCDIFQNTASNSGGGVYSVEGGALTNCLIRDNKSLAGGGGVTLYLDSAGTVNMSNCTVTGNHPGNKYYAGGIQCRHYILPLTPGYYNISNCIVWNNDWDEILWGNNSEINVSVTNCCVQGGYAGNGNIDLNPLFAMGPGGGFYLSQTTAGQAQNSPCLDSGSDFSEFFCFDSLQGRICLSEMTTRVDKGADINMVDIGYHYSTTPWDDTSVKIQMPSDYFRQGNQCSCTVTVSNDRGADLTGYPLYVLLEINGLILFAPGFTTTPADFLGEYPVFPQGETVVPVLPQFTWPSGAGSLTGVHWYAALFDPGMQSLFGDMDIYTFGWGE